MEKIYSKIDPNKLLHIIVRKEDLTPGRVEVISEDQFIQCAYLNHNLKHFLKSFNYLFFQDLLGNQLY